MTVVTEMKNRNPCTLNVTPISTGKHANFKDGKMCPYEYFEPKGRCQHGPLPTRYRVLNILNETKKPPGKFIAEINFREIRG